MTTTTTSIVATNCVAQVDNAAGTLKDISGSSNSIKMTPKNNIAEFRAFGDSWKTRKAVSKDIDSIEVKFVLSTAADEAYDLLKTWYWDSADTARTFQFDVPDSTAGSDRYSGECLLASLDMPFDAEADEVVRGTATLKPTGEVTRADIT